MTCMHNNYTACILYMLRQLSFLMKSDCLGCAVLLCLVVCLTLLASFFLSSASHIIMYTFRLSGEECVPSDGSGAGADGGRLHVAGWDTASGERHFHLGSRSSDC